MRFITLHCVTSTNNETPDTIEKISVNTSHIVSWRGLSKEYTGVMVVTGLEYVAKHSKFEVTSMIKSADSTNPKWDRKPEEKLKEVLDGTL